MSDMVYRPVWGTPQWESLEEAYLYNVDKGYLVQGVEDDNGEYVPELYYAWGNPNEFRESLEQIGSWVEPVINRAKPAAVGKQAVGHFLLGMDDNNAGTWIQVGENLSGGTQSFKRAVDWTHAINELDIARDIEDASIVKDLLVGALSRVASPGPTGQLNDKLEQPYELAYAMRYGDILYDPVHGIAIDTYCEGYEGGDQAVYIHSVDFPTLARHAEDCWKRGHTGYMPEMLWDTSEPVASTDDISGVQLEQLIRVLSEICAQAGTFVPFQDMTHERTDELIEVCELSARGHYTNMLHEPVSEWWDRTHPAKARQLHDITDITFDDVLGDLAVGRFGTMFKSHPEVTDEVIERLCTITGADRDTLLHVSTITDTPEAENDRAALNGLKEALSPATESEPKISDELADAIEKERETADVLRAYDAYITTACDARLFDTGWMPVGVDEFREHEYQNCWVRCPEGEDPFGWMYDSASEVQLNAVENEARLETSVGIIRAVIEGDSMAVDLKKLDGTCGRIAYIEATQPGEGHLYPTPLHILTYNGESEYADHQTDVQVDGPEMSYVPRNLFATDEPSEQGRGVRYGR